MAFRQPKSPAGITLIEVMAAIVILAIAVLGAGGYRYYSALDARKAADQSTAARVALLLSENWRDLGYDRTADYDPAAYFASDSEMTVEDSHVGPPYASGFTALGKYQIFVKDVPYYAALSYRNDAADLRTLNAVVGWAPNRNSVDGATIRIDKTFKLTTYVAD